MSLEDDLVLVNALTKNDLQTGDECRKKNNTVGKDTDLALDQNTVVGEDLNMNRKAEDGRGVEAGEKKLRPSHHGPNHPVPAALLPDEELL